MYTSFFHDQFCFPSLLFLPNFSLSSHLEKERENEENGKVGAEVEQMYLLLIDAIDSDDNDNDDYYC